MAVLVVVAVKMSRNEHEIPLYQILRGANNFCKTNFSVRSAGGYA